MHLKGRVGRLERERPRPTVADGERAERLRWLAALCATHGVCWPGLAQAAEAMKRKPADANRRRFLDAVREAVGQMEARGCGWIELLRQDEGKRAEAQNRQGDVNVATEAATAARDTAVGTRDRLKSCADEKSRKAWKTSFTPYHRRTSRLPSGKDRINDRTEFCGQIITG